MEEFGSDGGAGRRPLKLQIEITVDVAVTTA